MRVILGNLYGKVALCWLDDVLIWGVDAADLLLNMRQVFERFQLYGLFCAADKFEAYATTIMWCGRYFDSEGVSHDPARLQGLLDLAVPNDAAQLQHFLSCLGWLRSSLPDLARQERPLSDLLNKLLAEEPTRSAVAGKRHPITPTEWTKDCDDAYNTIKQLLSNSVKLAYPKQDYVQCVFTDGSHFGWGSMITQVPTCGVR